MAKLGEWDKKSLRQIVNAIGKERLFKSIIGEDEVIKFIGEDKIVKSIGEEKLFKQIANKLGRKKALELVNS